MDPTEFKACGFSNLTKFWSREREKKGGSDTQRGKVFDFLLAPLSSGLGKMADLIRKGGKSLFFSHNFPF